MWHTEKLEQQFLGDSVDGTMPFIVHIAMKDVTIQVAEEVDRLMDSRRLCQPDALIRNRCG